jgi:hypothetical protein
MAKMGNVSSAVTLRVGPGWLRFAVRGATELNWGSGWQRVRPVNHVAIDNNGHFASYFVPIPEGADSVQIRGTATWAGQWSAKDIAVWNIEKSKTR